MGRSNVKGKYRFPHIFSTEGQISSEMTWEVGLAQKSTVALREVWSSLKWTDPDNDSLGEDFFCFFLFCFVLFFNGLCSTEHQGLAGTASPGCQETSLPLIEARINQNKGKMIEFWFVIYKSK